MRIVNYANTENDANRVTSLVVTSALLALLLLGQFALALNSVGAIFTVESGYSQLESAESENDHPELLVPDFLHGLADGPNSLSRQGFEYHLPSAGIEVHASYANIRAPPLLS